MAYRFLFFIYPFFFLSCVSVSTINIQVLEPAPEPVTTYANTVIIVNRALQDNTDQENNFQNSSEASPLMLHNITTTEVIFSLADILNESPGLDYLDKDMLLEIPGSKEISIQDPLNPELVLFICDSLDANAVIALEVFNAELPDDIKITFISDEFGSYFLGEMYVNISALWRIYEGDYGEIINEHVWFDTINWEYAAFNAYEVPERIPSPEEALMESAYFTALNYARKISPYWIEQGRMYFERGLYMLRIASSHLNNGNYDRAKEIYTDLLDRRNDNVVAAALHNLALISEMRGEYPEAIKFAREAYKKRRHPATVAYIDILEERIKKAGELDNQLGRDR